jgi:hypothetical protein
MPLFDKVLRTTVAKQAEKVLVSQVRPYVKLDFEAKKEQFLEQFDADPVSQEISAGPETFSQVSELAGAGGNLFSLLGFKATQKPIETLREYIKDNTVLYKTGAGKVVGNKVIFHTDVYAPTEEEIDSVIAQHPESKLEWVDRSFTDLLARGISGLPNYLFDLTRDFSHIPSRSGPAIQTKKKPLRSGEVGPIPYVERILRVLSRILSPNK